MRVGVMYLGRIEATDRESVQTKFLVFGVPVAPLGSVFVTSEEGGRRGFDIPLYGPSVFAGYLRFYLACAAALAGAFAWLEVATVVPQGLMAFAAFAATIGWAFSMFFLGRLSDEERTRRELLRRATGIAAPPELLPPELRDELHAKLTRRWTVLGDGADWRAHLETGSASPDELPTLHALACYEDAPEHARMAARLISA